MIMTTKHLIFDFDGVIGNTFEAALCAKGKVDNLTKEEVAKEFDSYFTKSHHTRSSNVSPEMLEKMLKWATDFGTLMKEQDYSLFTEFLEEAAKIENTKMAIVSSGSHIYIKPKVKTIPLQFTHVLCFEDHHSKEEKVERVCKDWDVSVQDVYFFTDSISDVKELENIMDRNKIFGCVWGYQGYEKLATVLDEEHIFKNYSDIHKVFT